MRGPDSPRMLVGRLALPMESILVGLIATLLHVLRLPPAGWDTMYAEDGNPFVMEAVTGRFEWLEPYAGYLHLLPRVAASIVTNLLPPSAWANGMIVAAGLVVGAVAATSYAAVRSLGQVRGVALAAASVVVFLPQGGVELIGTISTSHTFALIGAAMAIIARPRTPRGVLVAGLGVLVFALTEIQVIILLPLALVLAWRRRPVAAFPVAGLCLGLGAQWWATTRSSRATAQTWPEFLEIARGYLFNVVLGTLSGHGKWLKSVVVGANGWGWAIPIVIGALWCAFLVVATRGSRSRRLLVLALVLASVFLWTVAFSLNIRKGVDYLDSPILNRWGSGPAMLLALTLPVAFARHDGEGDRSTVSRRRRLAATTIVALGTVAALVSYRIDTPRRGLSWSETANHAARQCPNISDEWEVPQLPAGWSVTLPCWAWEPTE